MKRERRERKEAEGKEKGKARRSNGTVEGNRV